MDISDSINQILYRKRSDVWWVSPETTVYEAIELMAEKNIGAVLVKEGKRLLGIMSERDYTRKMILKGKLSKQTKVRDIMTFPLITATPEHTVEDCMRLITEKRVRHLPILDGEKIVGVISIGDLLNWTLSAQRDRIHQLENYITGSYPG